MKSEFRSAFDFMFKENVLLKNYSNYKLGGPASYFYAPKNSGELKTALKEVKKKSLPLFVLGGGTNVLFDDDGFPGAVIHPELKSIKRHGNKVYAESGVGMDELLSFCADEGLSGLEWAGGLPGTLGGAIRGNAGAFGGEIKDNIEEVSSIHAETLRVRSRNNKTCQFSYRSSIFKEDNGKEVIISAVFKLKKGDSQAIHNAIKEKISYRKAKQPIYYPNVGSMFKNVPVEMVPKEHLEKVKDKIKNDPFPVVPAAVMISRAGLGGISFGGAMVSPHHVNFIVNVCDASSKDVKALLKLVNHRVKEVYNISLEEEVLLV